MWEIEGTDEFADWYRTLSVNEQRAIDRAMTVLEQDGPQLGRPLVGTIRGSRHANMKEVRPPATDIRILFAFDPRRMAILLLGGDKSGQWERWYIVNIPIADALYDEHIETLRKEGLL
jgi:hypothetical protein